MPRANRCFVPDCVWHITQRCHDREFLLRAAADRDVWRRWLWNATQRHGLCVLDFVATSNHIHLLVHDQDGDGTVARAMQLVQGQTAQAHNRRYGRAGAFWQDRYHAVAVESGDYLWRCLTYIDLNMVRARVVDHPNDWAHGGYGEIQRPRERCPVIDLERLAWLAECGSVSAFQAAHREQVEYALSSAVEKPTRQAIWTDAIAVGSASFTESIRAKLGLSKLKRTTDMDGVCYVLREEPPVYRHAGIGGETPAAPGARLV